MGYAADGVDPCPEFVESTLNRICQYGATVKEDTLAPPVDRQQSRWPKPAAALKWELEDRWDRAAFIVE